MRNTIILKLFLLDFYLECLIIENALYNNFEVIFT